MKQLTELATPFTELAETLSLPGHDLPWIQQLRQQAKTQFENTGLPAKKHEDWKYTNLTSLAQQRFNHNDKAGAIDSAQCDALALLSDSYRVVIVDGVFNSLLSTINDVEAGLTIQPFSEGIAFTEQQLAQQAPIEKSGLNALNTLLMKEGVIIHVATETIIEKPIELLVINTGSTQDLAIHLRNMIVLESGAEAALIEHYTGLNQDKSFTNLVTEVKLEKAAHLRHYKLQQECSQAFHIATLAASQATASRWDNYNVSLGGQLARNDIYTRLQGQQAHATLAGLYLLNEDQHLDNHTRIDHSVPHTSSDELYKGVLDQESHAVFNGKVVVHKDAQKTDSNQYNHNLLLSRGCEIDTKPEMEIYADDVKCGHGSTVGQLDPEQLFFLRARGLDEISARNLLTQAFTMEVLNQIPQQTVRQVLTERVAASLAQAGASV